MLDSVSIGGLSFELLFAKTIQKVISEINRWWKRIWDYYKSSVTYEISWREASVAAFDYRRVILQLKIFGAAGDPINVILCLEIECVYESSFWLIVGKLTKTVDAILIGTFKLNHQKRIFSQIIYSESFQFVIIIYGLFELVDF